MTETNSGRVFHWLLAAALVFLAGAISPPNYESDMPAFGGVLSDDEVRAVPGHIESSWPEQRLAYRRQIKRSSRDRR